jgi:hypothetical protein
LYPEPERILNTVPVPETLNEYGSDRFRLRNPRYVIGGGKPMKVQIFSVAALSFDKPYKTLALRGHGLKMITFSEAHGVTGQ